MNTSVKAFIQSFYEEIGNKKNLDKFSDFYHKDFLGQGSPFIGTGFVWDFEIEDRMVVKHILPNSPASETKNHFLNSRTANFVPPSSTTLLPALA